MNIMKFTSNYRQFGQLCELSIIFKRYYTPALGEQACFLINNLDAVWIFCGDVSGAVVRG